MVDLISFNQVVPVVNQIETNLYCQRQAEHDWLDKYEVPEKGRDVLKSHENDTFLA